MRRHLPLSLLLLALTALPLAFALPQDAPPDDMARYWFGLIHRGPAWTAEATDDVMELQRAHLANIGRLAQSGELVLAGPFEGGGDLRGLFVYDVETEEQARALADSDPAVAAGRLTVELIPWWGPAALRDLAASTRGRDDGTPAHGDDASASKHGDDASAATRLEGAIVEAACGECQLDLDGDECTLAIRVDGRVLRVTGTAIDDHGDAHAADGFCNAIRQARVTGRIEGDVFVAESFELLP